MDNIRAEALAISKPTGPAWLVGWLQAYNTVPPTIFRRFSIPRIQCSASLLLRKDGIDGDTIN